MCEPPNERRSLGAEAVREQGVLSGPDSLPERVRARVTEADVFGVKSLASERRGRVSLCVTGKGVCVTLRTTGRACTYVCCRVCVAAS